MTSKCEKCGHNLFKVEIRTDCHKCTMNGIWNVETEDVEYGKVPKETDSLTSVDDGYCEMGNSFDNGCWIITCEKCSEIIYIPTMDN